MAQPTMGARIRAARVMAGYTSAEKLATALGLNGAGRTNLYRAERDEKAIGFPVLSEVAYACGLPVEFFTADFDRLAEISEDPRAVIARELRAATERAERRRQGSPEDPPPPPPEDPGP